MIIIQLNNKILILVYFYLSDTRQKKIYKYNLKYLYKFANKKTSFN